MFLDSISDWLDKLQDRATEMAANRERDAIVIASDLLAQVQLRIQTTGLSYTGAKFSPYSAGYKKQRAKAGAQTAYVDFTVTGEMWRNTRPEVLRSSETEVVVEIKARTRNNQIKLNAALTQPASSPRGNLLIPNEEELAIAQAANVNRVIKYFSADA